MPNFHLEDTGNDNSGFLDLISPFSLAMHFARNLILELEQLDAVELLRSACWPAFPSHKKGGHFPSLFLTWISTFPVAVYANI